MAFTLKTYRHPDFDQPQLKDAPDASFVRVEKTALHHWGITPQPYFRSISESMGNGFFLWMEEWIVWLYITTDG